MQLGRRVLARAFAPRGLRRMGRRTLMLGYHNVVADGCVGRGDAPRRLGEHLDLIGEGADVSGVP